MSHHHNVIGTFSQGFGYLLRIIHGRQTLTGLDLRPRLNPQCQDIRGLLGPILATVQDPENGDVGPGEKFTGLSGLPPSAVRDREGSSCLDFALPCYTK